MTAGVGFAVLAGFGRLATDDLVEVAGLAARSFFLIDQSEVRFIEFLEKFVSRDLDQVFIPGFGASGDSMRIPVQLAQVH
jgi:hypothetical protein